MDDRYKLLGGTKSKAKVEVLKIVPENYEQKYIVTEIFAVINKANIRDR